MIHWFMHHTLSVVVPTLKYDLVMCVYYYPMYVQCKPYLSKELIKGQNPTDYNGIISVNTQARIYVYICNSHLHP